MKHVLTYFLPLTPFCAELISDYVMIVIKNKADVIRFKHRVAMVAFVLLITFIFLPPIETLKALILACIPFCFFDNLLAWLRKKRGFDYKGKTKNWDLWYTKFNPYAVMTFRILLAGVLTFLYIKL